MLGTPQIISHPHVPVLELSGTPRLPNLWTWMDSTPTHPKDICGSYFPQMPLYSTVIRWERWVLLSLYFTKSFTGGSAVKNLPAMEEMLVWSLDGEDSLEEEMATHSSILAWKVPWIEQPGGLQSMGSQRVRRDLGTRQQCTKCLYVSSLIYLFHQCVPEFLFDSQNSGCQGTVIVPVSHIRKLRLRKVTINPNSHGYWQHWAWVKSSWLPVLGMLRCLAFITMLSMPGKLSWFGQWQSSSSIFAGWYIVNSED